MIRDSPVWWLGELSALDEVGQRSDDPFPCGCWGRCFLEIVVVLLLLGSYIGGEGYVSSSSLFDLDRNIALLFVGGGDKIDGRLDCFTAL